MNGQPLRIIADQDCILSPSLIPTLGFGGLSITARDPAGPIGTAQRRYRYQLIDGCIIEKYEQAGRVCFACRDEIESVLAQAPDVLLSPLEIDWLATPCRAHTYTCHHPCCAKNACLRHIVTGIDGHHYCIEHHLQLTDQVALQAMEGERGVLRTRALRFLGSLFLGGWGT